MFLGWVFAALTGIGLPAFAFLMGDILNAFDPATSKEDMLDTISFIALI